MCEDPCRGPDTRWKLIFSSDRTRTASMSIGMAEIAPGGRLDLHHHEPPEIYHVLEGSGIVEIGGVPHELEPGISVFIPGNAKHMTMNGGAVPLRLLFIFPTDAFRHVIYQFEERPVRGLAIECGQHRTADCCTLPFGMSILQGPAASGLPGQTRRRDGAPAR